MFEFNEIAYILSWDVEHFEELGILDWKEDILIEEFEGYESGALYQTKKFEHPTPIIYQGYKPVVEHIDYPYPDNAWNIMSRRMYETLLSVGDFPHRVIPTAIIDSRTPPWSWFEETAITKENAYDEGRPSPYKTGKNLREEVCFGDFVLVQMTEYLDIFDYGKMVMLTKLTNMSSKFCQMNYRRYSKFRRKKQGHLFLQKQEKQ
jgi:hypothetical protein